MFRALSSKDIIDATGGEIQMITYPELTKYDDIDKVFKAKGDAIALLYPFEGDGKTKSMYGHWTLLMKNKRHGKTEIEFFDSYKYKPDDQLKFAKKPYRKQQNMEEPHLTKLLIKALDKGYNVEYNNHRFQEKSSEIQTCGRYTIIRYLMRDLDIDQFNNLMKMLREETGKSNDRIVTDLTHEVASPYRQDI